MPSRKGGLTRLRNIDLRDRELLLAAAECAQEDGTIMAADVADYLGVTSNGKRTPAGTVSSRLSWARRLGYIERHDAREFGGRASDSPRFTITALGHALIGGKLTKTQQAAIERADAGSMLLLMRQLTQRGYVDAEDGVAAALRREYQYQLEARRHR